MNHDVGLSENDLLSARLRMVDEQLTRRGINNEAVLAAMRRVPRHKFVIDEDLTRAYGDHPLEIGFDQTISQPYIVASMTQELHLERNSRVLEIGTGCGYQTAVLAELVDQVFTIELITELHEQSVRRLSQLGYKNISFIAGDGSQGWPENAPFDAIIVTAAASAIPPALLRQLGDTGRMIIPVGVDPGNQQLFLVEQDHGQVDKRVLYEVRFVPLRTLHEKSAGYEEGEP